MRKLIVTEFVSLDGVMEAPGGEEGYPHTAWVSRHTGGDEHFQYKFVEVLEAESLLLGRVTYQSFAGAWPGREGAFADRMTAMSKYVISNTLTDPGWSNVTVLAGDMVTAVKALKAGEGGPIQVPGSRTLAQSLLKAGLVDELRLMIFPVILGSGKRLWPDSPDEMRMTLHQTLTFSSGIVALTYRPEAA